MADYLESYAQRFNLPVQRGVKVDKLWKEGDRFITKAGDVRFESQNVVVAMANYQQPRVPAFAADLDPGILQLHSHDYRNPSQLQDGSVLIVGAGNSGADIGLEIARAGKHKIWMSGKESGHIPFPIDSVMARFFLVRIIRFVGHHVLSVSTPIGRKLRPKLLSRAAPLVRVKPRDLVSAGIERVPKVADVRNGQPLLADDHTLNVRNVIWCTGYHPGFSWIHLPIFGEDGRPMHERGVVTRVPGMYFVGLHYLYSMTSATVIGVGRDAERIARAIRERTRLVRAA
jgi:putative flavoprotein involved in K+ transport